MRINNTTAPPRPTTTTTTTTTTATTTANKCNTVNTTARYGIGREECFYEEYGLLVPAFLALPGLFAITVVLHWAVHHATALCYPVENH